MRRLAGRDTELASLRNLLEHAASDGTTVAVLTGPRGVGKTALLEHFLARLSAPPVRHAQAVVWESGRAYGVMEQLLGPLGPDVPRDPVSVGQALAESEVRVVLVDDVQWCDPETIRAVSSSARHHPSAGLLVVFAQQREPGSDPTVDELIEQTAESTIAVEPLSTAAVIDIAAEHGVTLLPTRAEQLRVHTGGLARNVIALLNESPEETWSESEVPLPPTAAVWRETARCMEACSEPARRLVESVAIVGSPAIMAEAVELARLSDPLRAVDQARVTGLITATIRRGTTILALTGPMTQAAVRASLGVAESTYAHQRAAAIVTDPVRRLGHEIEATLFPDPSLAERLDALAEERSATGAWSVAAELLIKASRLSTEDNVQDERLLRGVDALVGSGDVSRAATYIAEVASLRETPLQGAVLGYLAIVRGRRTEAAGRLSRAWDLVLPKRDPEIAAQICQRYVLHCLADCQGEELVRWADHAVELAQTDGTVAVEAEAIRGLGVAAAGRPAEGMSGYLDLAERTPHNAQAQRVRMAIGWLNLILDRVDDAIAELETAVPTGFLGGSQRISLWARAWLARARFARGEWDSALETAHSALDLAERTGSDLITPLIHWTTAQVYTLRGDWGAAEQSLLAGVVGPNDYPIMRIPACLARAHYAEAKADYAGVLQALAPLLRLPDAVTRSGFWPWADIYANALVVQGRYDEAEHFLDTHEHIAVERGHRSEQARLGYARGRLLGVRGDLEAARDRFEKSLRLLEDLPLPYDRARVNFAFGQMLRRGGKRREADAVIVTARDLYARIGAESYVLRCDRELKAAGVRTGQGDRTKSAHDVLTAQERAVGELVSGGRTNKDVARELFLSTKTVQYHLTRIYMKLGIRSRGELAAHWAALRDEER